MTVNRIALLHATQALTLAAVDTAQLVHETARVIVATREMSVASVEALKQANIQIIDGASRFEAGQKVQLRGTIGHMRILDVENGYGHGHVDGRHRRAAEQQLAETVEVLSSGMTPEQRAWNKQVEEKKRLKKGKR